MISSEAGYGAEAPLVYIVILTWNHWELTQACLASLQRLTYPNHCVLVVDNGSNDGTVDLVRRHFPAATVLANAQNLGFAGGCNVGIRHALANQAEYVFLLNNDTVVPPELLDVLVVQANELPNVGIVAPALTYFDKPDQLWFTGSRRHWLTLESVDFGPLGPRRHVRPDEHHELDYIFGTAMFIPTSLFRQVGLFDEAFFMYYEDMDFCLRVQSAGYRLYYIPGVSVQHRVSASTTSTSSCRYYHKARSSVLFFRKHAGFWRGLVIVPYRFSSLLRTMGRLACQGQWGNARAYLRGLADGLRSLAV
ncbi:MAG: glycosyltransferase family 2 protein [Chloroflexi bacterium]|nr:glycosyltransferase family 2 protein [Chloroflexota bacterium]MCI0580098.1 glycosyltransferase family 2 protein [Chloroflexota bacterium]MCI0649326.1 glycosyltransferase family 2 protein [Chloroflexota bacterium]MCI0725941.1 glycosyltransferase family 2 protein [Chloroflexota bacterium]